MSKLINRSTNNNETPLHNRKAYFVIGNNRGVAIGPILFIVALLGVLAATIAASSGAFKAPNASESGKGAASAILQIADTLKDGYEKVMLQPNVTASNFRMLPSKTTAVTDVFSSSGGNIIYPTSSLSGSADTINSGSTGDVWYFFPIATNIGLGGSTYGNGGANQPVMAAFLIVPKNTCDAINNVVVGKSISAPIAYNLLYNAYYSQIYVGFSQATLKGKLQGCVQDVDYFGFSGYVFFQVLGPLTDATYFNYSTSAQWQGLATEPKYAALVQVINTYNSQQSNNSGN